MVWDLATMKRLNGPWPESPEGVVKRLEERNPEALLLEPREVYDAALVDLTDTPADDWERPVRTWVAVYDARGCVEAIQRWMDCEPEEAQEWFDFNTSGAWMGAGTPTFRWDDLDET